MNFNILDYLALIIAIISAIFTGVRWYSTNREQVLRIRPQVFIDNLTITHMSPTSIKLDMSIKNVGLIPAKNVKFSDVLHIGGTEISQQSSEGDQTIIVPNQILKRSPFIDSNNLNLTADSYFIFRVDYEYNNQKYFFWIRAVIDSNLGRLVMSKGDAN